MKGYMEIQGLGELEKSDLKYEDFEMDCAIKRMLNVHTYQELIKCRDGLNAREKEGIVRVVYRLKHKGYSTIDDHLANLTELSTNISHLERCLSYSPPKL